jgi:Domain of unknown function (DUF4145)
MKCPHCLVAFSANSTVTDLSTDPDGWWSLEKTVCPACRKMILSLQNRVTVPGRPGTGDLKGFTLVRPRGSLRPPCPPEVPDFLRGDYAEACLVLPDSPKSAAALGRRCLQAFLHETLGIKGKTLWDEIDTLLKDGNLPSGLQESVDAIRNIGNFAAHPLKSEQSGLILDVEPGEAEWTLEVLEELFDFYFVRPKRIREKRDAMNAKLAEAGKPNMK